MTTVEASPLQQQVWYSSLLDGDQSAYVIPMVHRIDGQLDVERLARAVEEAVFRHEGLSGTFIETEGVLYRSDRRTRFTVNMVAAGSPADGEIAAHGLAQEGLALDTDCFHTSIIRVNDGLHYLVMRAHHVVFDAWSRDLLYQAVTEAWNGAVLADRPGAAGKHGRERPGRTVEDEAVTYWNQRLAGVKSFTLGVRQWGPRRSLSGGACRLIPVRASTWKNVELAAGRVNRSVNSTMLAVVSLGLARLLDNEDFVIGTTINVRRSLAALHEVGLQVNLMPLRVSIPRTQEPRAAVANLIDTFLEDLEYSDLPYARIVSGLRLDRDGRSDPLTRVCVDIGARPRVQLRLPGVHVAEQHVPCRSSKFDLSLSISKTNDDTGLVHALWHRGVIDDAEALRLVGGVFTYVDDLAAGIVADTSSTMSAFEE